MIRFLKDLIESSPKGYSFYTFLLRETKHIVQTLAIEEEIMHHADLHKVVIDAKKKLLKMKKMVQHSKNLETSGNFQVSIVDSIVAGQIIPKLQKQLSIAIDDFWKVCKGLQTRLAVYHTSFGKPYARSGVSFVEKLVESKEIVSSIKKQLLH